MKKEWKYRLYSGLGAIILAGTFPAAAYADEEVPPGLTESFQEGALQNENALPEETSLDEGMPLAAEEQIDAFFDGSVFVGDSVMMGFRNYAMRRSDTYLGRMQFLASGSFSVHNALWPVSSKSVHPLYQGQQRYVWESLGLLKPKKVFLFFGLNDMNMGPLESTCDCYAQVIANIKSTCPEAEIHIISMTYTLKGKGKENLNNDNIRRFNDMLRAMALENGWGFMDLATPLSDANGDLAEAYCSDNYVHHTNAAYDVWSAVLRDYAKSQIEGTCPYPAAPQKPEEEPVQEPEAAFSDEAQDPVPQETGPYWQLFPADDEKQENISAENS